MPDGSVPSRGEGFLPVGLAVCGCADPASWSGGSPKRSKAMKAPPSASRSGHLRVVGVTARGAAGPAAAAVEVNNRSATACVLQGPPLVELRGAAGNLLAQSGNRPPFIPVSQTTDRSMAVIIPPNSARPPVDLAAGPYELQIHPHAVTFILAQGPCPGGVFPRGATLDLAMTSGRVPILRAPKDGVLP